ncbi:type II toxin-antitoxin system HigB family toxin [Photorhabdus akhurstii]|uniref:type II toxin-antitoxin system HigB family toxin n=1 Tax=Photorhabdus akhurstii TaxID=171438 RepID=UPI003704CD66
MHVISKDPFEKAARDFPNDADAIIATYKQLKEKDFEHPVELRSQFPSLDNFKYRDKWWVIDIGGQNLRALRVLMDQYRLSYSDLKEEIGSKSLVSQILSGKRSLTIAHIKALSKRFNVRPDLFL